MYAIFATLTIFYHLEFRDFIRQLTIQLKQPLPGHEAHMRLASVRRISEMKFVQDTADARKSAVLLLFYPTGNKIFTVFIQRPQYNGIHSGQISFPGGKMEDSDPDHFFTALRESQEETGIQPDEVTILGTLTPLYIPPSHFIVLPVIGYQHKEPILQADPQEVESIITVSLEELLDPASFQEQKVTFGSWSATVPCFSVRTHIIWGATAMIMNELIEIIRAFPSTR